MSIISDEELPHLSIGRMILHVVGDERFEPAPEREVEFEDFFLERVKETNSSALHEFEDESLTKECLERIASGETAFEVGAQSVSRDFSSRHVGASIEGAFFIFSLSSNLDNCAYYSLIKYDFREAIEQVQRGERAQLRRIVHALISDKRAIQKSALIKIQDGVAERSVAARDRTRPQPDISDYFAAFLGVRRARSNDELTRAAKEVLKDALQQCKEVLPDGNVPRAYRRAQAALSERPIIDNAGIIEALFAAADHPDDEAIQQKLETVARRRIAARKLEDVEFQPSRQILRSPAIRQIKTTEGVVLRYPDTADEPIVERHRDGGDEIFTIRTKEVTEDRIVRTDRS